MGVGFLDMCDAQFCLYFGIPSFFPTDCMLMTCSICADSDNFFFFFFTFDLKLLLENYIFDSYSCPLEGLREK